MRIDFLYTIKFIDYIIFLEGQNFATIAMPLALPWCGNRQQRGNAMFYHGGMTLGYLTPPAKAEKTARAVTAPQNNREQSDETDQARDRELSRAFLTPWHLLY